MDDFERYGDYNEIDEPPGRKNLALLLLKILIGAVCLSVVGLLIFRMVLASYYPDSMKRIYFNDTLTEYYYENNGDIEILTQTVRYNTDNGDEGNFFAANVIFIRELGQLQLSIRYNVSVYDNLRNKYGIELDPEAENNFTFRLVRNPYTESGEPFEIGHLSYEAQDEKMMYRYHKLVFDGVDFELFSGNEGEEDREIDWIRVEIIIPSDDPNEAFGAIPVYEGYIEMRDYELESWEVPSR